eukprot:SAG31_NODE_25085_length_468_cov_0.840108_1_plen_114_part_10
MPADSRASLSFATADYTLPTVAVGVGGVTAEKILDKFEKRAMLEPPDKFLEPMNPLATDFLARYETQKVAPSSTELGDVEDVSERTQLLGNAPQETEQESLIVYIRDELVQGFI